MGFQTIFLSLFAIWTGVNAVADCPTKYYAITTSSAPLTVYSPNYPPYGFPTPGGCQFTVVAPIYHEIFASCLIYIGDTRNCLSRDALLVQIDGTTNLDKSNVYYRCGANDVHQFVSAFNSMTIGYKSTEYSGFYNCTITTRRQSKCDCGTIVTPKIVGGERAQQNRYPYMGVMLKNDQKVNTATPTVKGGATIISTTAAISSAHVFTENNQRLQPQQMILSVGRDDLSKGVQYDTPYSANYIIAKIIIPSTYDEQTGYDDIAVILTKDFIMFNRGVYPCCLPGLNEPVNQYDGQKVIEMGFGSTDFGAPNANALKVATASMLPNPQCKKTYGNELTDRDSCTYSQSRNDTCQGDSGGPVVLESYRHFIICVIKQGSLCGNGSPGMCQRPSPYRSWITDVAGPLNFFCFYK